MVLHCIFNLVLFLLLRTKAMKIRHYYAIGFLCNVIVPISLLSYYTLTNRKLSKKQYKVLVYVSVTGRALVLTGHFKVIKKIIKL